MTKTNEDLLLAAAEKAEAALDNLTKVAGKVARVRVSPDEQDEVPSYARAASAMLRQKLGMAETMFAAAVQQLYGVTLPTAQPMAPVPSIASRGHEGVILQGGGRLDELPRKLAQQASHEAPRPIGRLAKDADEPGAGEIVVGQPIKSQVAPLREPGVDFIKA